LDYIVAKKLPTVTTGTSKSGKRRETAKCKTQQNSCAHDDDEDKGKERKKRKEKEKE